MERDAGRAAGDRWRAGAFTTFDPRLRLTAPGSAGRSVWHLPGWFAPGRGRPPLTYHEEPARWRRVRGGVRLRTVGRDQEFVLDADHYPEAERWARAITALPVS